MTNIDERELEWLLNEKYTGEQTPEYYKDVARLEKGEPIDYVIGSRPFLGCTIDLSEKPLIPRTETEFWVEKAISEMREKLSDTPMKILDIFAGSGCIGIAILHHLESSTVDFAEKDKKICTQIEKNITLNGIDTERTKVIRSDVFKSVSGTYDYIFANPPYIDPSLKETVQDSVLKYEPHEALFAKNAGLDYIETLIEDARERLNPGGILFIECSPEQQPLLSSYVRGADIEHEFWKDQHDNWRVLKMWW
jgi:HemK-like putative methylase